MTFTTRQKMTAARMMQLPVLRARQLVDRGPMAEVTRRGVRWDLDLREGIDFSIWLRGYFEPETVATYRRLVRPGVTVLDVGANIGAHTLYLAGAVGSQGKVVAFEPTAPAFERLTHNVALNPEIADRITLQQTMLLATADSALPDRVVSSWPLLPRSQLDPVAPGRLQPTTGANSARLDDALRTVGISEVAFIKLDVDGFELDVLLGGKRLLEDSPPLILLELAPSQVDATGRRVEDVLDLLASHRYRVTTLRRREVTHQMITKLRQTRAGINVLALPPTT
jgi:FkbM family methyltransferase